MNLPAHYRNMLGTMNPPTAAQTQQATLQAPATQPTMMRGMARFFNNASSNTGHYLGNRRIQPQVRR